MSVPFAEIFPSRKPIIGVVPVGPDCTQVVKDMMRYAIGGVDGVLFKSGCENIASLVKALEVWRGQQQLALPPLKFGLHMPGEDELGPPFAKNLDLHFVHQRYDACAQYPPKEGRVALLTGVQQDFAFEYACIASSSAVVIYNRPGAPVRLDALAYARASGVPILAGTGITARNIAEQFDLINGLYVYTSCVQDDCISLERVRELVRAVDGLRGDPGYRSTMAGR